MRLHACGPVPLSRYVRRLDRDTVLYRRWKLRPGSEARFTPLLEEMLRRGTRQGWWRGARVAGLFPARAAADGLEVGDKPPALLRVSPRLRMASRVGLQVVTIGARVTSVSRRLGRSGRVFDQFLLHGLAAELTEALAAWSADDLANRAGWPRSRRYSPGYPVWPELADQRRLFRLLRPARIGIRLTRQFQMVPEYSTSAIVLPGHVPKLTP